MTRRGATRATWVVLCWSAALAHGAMRAGDAAAQTVRASTEASVPGASSAEPRRIAGGQPDISGRWRAALGGTYNTTAVESGNGTFDRLLDEAAGRPPKPRPSRVVDPPDGRIPYLPWAQAKQLDVQEHAEAPRRSWHIDPRARCLPGGVPRETFPTAFRFVQVPGYVIFLGDQKSVSRIIPLDGRPFIDESIKLWMGDSRGRWEGNTLVIEVRNQNSKGRFDMVGNFASDRVRVIERWTIVNERELDYRATIDDPSVYSRPWTIASRILRVAGTGAPHEDELWEDACHEGERSAEHMLLEDDPLDPHGGGR